MSDAELKFPQWQGPRQELILEFDHKSCLKNTERRNSDPRTAPATIIDHGNDSRVEKIALHDAQSINKTSLSTTRLQVLSNHQILARIS
jgi:hypothetical protein